MQIITLSGRIGADAETRTVNQNEVTSFNIACDQGYGDKKVTNWFRINAWGKKGTGAAPYLLKGGVVTVVGELEIGEYNGKPQYNVRANDFTLPAKVKSDDRGERRRPYDDEPGGIKGFDPSRDDDLDDNVPF